jgi:hypothetical protein
MLMMELPVPQVFRNAVVGPLLQGSNKFQLIFQCSPPDLPLEHWRASPEGGIRSICQITQMEEDKARTARNVEGPVIFAGPFHNHFGHFVAECIHRLYAKKRFPHLASAKIAFQALGWKQFSAAPWASDVLAMCGIDMADIILIDRPMRFAELHVPVQGRILGGMLLIEGYADLFPLADLPAVPEAAASPHLYVSRARHMYSGSFFGESMLENLLADEGFTIVHPESMPLKEFILLLRQAETITFCEGSAIHNLELCGRIRAKAFVIGRRGGTAERFGAILDSIVASWEVADSTHTGVPLDWDSGRERPSWQRACAYVDIPSLIARLAAFTGKALRTPSPAELRDGIMRDIAACLLDPRSTRATTSDEQLGKLMRMMRDRHIGILKSDAHLKDILST